jgi:hypothetical protein
LITPLLIPFRTATYARITAARAAFCLQRANGTNIFQPENRNRKG